MSHLLIPYWHASAASLLHDFIPFFTITILTSKMFCYSDANTYARTIYHDSISIGGFRNFNMLLWLKSVMFPLFLYVLNPNSITGHPGSHCIIILQTRVVPSESECGAEFVISSAVRPISCNLRIGMGDVQLSNIGPTIVHILPLNQYIYTYQLLMFTSL